ncbi:formylglycine-generating enzyme family protein [Flagellimonas sp.]|uniref:formylglycine-generating enzyme family protein n=1 Tax=Flagellimonas sp. TaxID=2058762 RepID=UPI003BA96492
MISGTIKSKCLLIFTVTITVFTANTSFAQSNEVLAKSTYLQAEENFQSKNFKKTIKNLDNTIKYLGESNGRIEALYVKTYKALNDFIEAEKHLALYFEMADESRNDYMEMVKLSSSIKEKAESRKKEKEAIEVELQKFMSPDYFVKIEGGNFILELQQIDFSGNIGRYRKSVKSFSMGKTEVTYGLYLAYCYDVGKKRPYRSSTRPKYTYNDAIAVNYLEAKRFCQWASKKLGKNISIPTVEQWQFAAKGGNKSKGFKYSGSNNLDEVAWYYDNMVNSGYYGAVAQKKPNELGLYDMSGNLAEWTSSIHPNNGFPDSNFVIVQGCSYISGKYSSIKKCFGGKMKDDYDGKTGFRMVIN